MFSFLLQSTVIKFSKKKKKRKKEKKKKRKRIKKDYRNLWRSAVMKKLPPVAFSMLLSLYKVLPMK
jgi:hypothetical protein